MVAPSGSARRELSMATNLKHGDLRHACTRAADADPRHRRQRRPQSDNAWLVSKAVSISKLGGGGGGGGSGGGPAAAGAPELLAS
eukprot:5488001-Pyramimonas_sp.AAC.1